MAAVGLVTGGTGGIGSAICSSLAARGFAVVAGDLDVDVEGDRAGGSGSLAPGTVTPAHMDVTDDDSVQAVVDRAAAGGELRAVVNCAGVVREAKADGMTQSAADEMWAVNVFGAGRVVKASLPHLDEGATIVNIGSIAGRVGRFPGTGLYSATKSGLEGLTRVLACELAPRRIRVNCVAPGFIRVPMGPEWNEMSGGEDALVAHVPLGRLGDVSEVAEVVAFLLSDAASYVTGAVIRVDGGVGAW